MIDGNRSLGGGGISVVPEKATKDQKSRRVFENWNKRERGRGDVSYQQDSSRLHKAESFCQNPLLDLTHSLVYGPNMKKRCRPKRTEDGRTGRVENATSRLCSINFLYPSKIP